MNPEESGYIDMKNEWQVVLHFRDLINMGPMLQMDVDEEIWKFKKKCMESGYSRERVEELVQKACVHTIYEQQMPHRIKDKDRR